jgi:PAS domain S-box-containing protein
MTPPTFASSGERTAARGTPVETIDEQRRFLSEPGAAGAARHELDHIAARVLEPAVLESARLLTSELVTNAVRHGPNAPGDQIRLRVTVRDDAVRVEVSDPGVGFQHPAGRHADVGGWGLMLVAGLSDRWGVLDGAPTTVWFEIDREPEEAAAALEGAPASGDEARVRMALDAGGIGTWDWDLRTGDIRWSERLEEIHGLEPGTFGGRFDDFQADIHPEDRARVVGSIDRAMRRRRGYAMDYRIVRSSDGAVRWLSVRGRVIRDERGSPAVMAGVCADITERKDAERSLAMQYAVARVLATAPSVGEAGHDLLAAIGRALGWELGAMWRVDEELRVLRLVGEWHAMTSTARFLEESREFLFERGVGLPGRVWASGLPAWVPDVSLDDNFPRAPFAVAEGLHSGFAFPVTLGTQVLGVIEFFSHRIREPNEPLLELIGAIGAQIGQYLERESTENELVESEARKSAVLEAALDAIITMDDAGRVVEMNPAAAEMFGYDRESVIGRELAELVIPPADRERHREALRRFRRTGRSRILGRRLELTGMRADGGEFPVELTITRVELPDPELSLFTGYIRDITSRRRAEELKAELFESERTAREQVEHAHGRVAFLAEASVVLSSSLDSRRTLAKVSRLVVPTLADWCSVDLLEADGSIASVAVAHADPAKVELAREYRRRYPPQADQGGIADALASGRPQLYRELTDEMLEVRIADPEQREIARTLGVRSVMIVPLEARGRALGTITLASAEPARRFDDEDLELAQEVARRAALAIDNSRLYEERSHIARTLQRSLLPRRLPEIPGIEIVALYQPAGVMQTEVGGDFYDAFECGEHAWGIVVGDVCGKGVEAAALTGMARHTLRASAMRDGMPSSVLRDLNRIMLHEDGERFCTVALGRLSSTGRGCSLTIACAGHPAPIVVRTDGRVETIGAPGSLLGLFDDVEISDVSTTLRAGDQAVLFTDGLIDSRHPTALDDRTLRAMAASCAGLSAQETVDRFGGAAADPGGEAPDDICILVIRVAD